MYPSQQEAWVLIGRKQSWWLNVESLTLLGSFSLVERVWVHWISPLCYTLDFHIKPCVHRPSVIVFTELSVSRSPWLDVSSQLSYRDIIVFSQLTVFIKCLITGNIYCGEWRGKHIGRTSSYLWHPPPTMQPWLVWNLLYRSGSSHFYPSFCPCLLPPRHWDYRCSSSCLPKYPLF